MNRPTCVIAEDEAMLRDELRETLGALWPELQVVAEVEDGLKAVRAFESHAPRILFLDIEMAGLNGLEVAALASRRCHVVFVTAYDKYAVSAFEQGAVDYVLKPFTPARLGATIARLKERLNAPPAPLEGLLAAWAQRETARGPLRWIRASKGTETVLITLNEVFFFQSDSKYTIVMTAGGEAVIRMAIQALEEQLDPESFWRIHRGTIVNLNEIAAVRRGGNGTLQLKLKRYPGQLVVSATYAHLFRQM